MNFLMLSEEDSSNHGFSDLLKNMASDSVKIHADRRRSGSHVFQHVGSEFDISIKTRSYEKEIETMMKYAQGDRNDEEIAAMKRR